MLEQIFSSKARTKILKFFCIHGQEKYFVRELTRKLGLQLNSARRELANLEKFGFVKSENHGGKKYYLCNQKFDLLPEIKNLVFKALALEEMKIAHHMSRIPGLNLLIFTGVLTKTQAPTDVLIVGKVSKSQFDRYLKKIAEGIPDELRYTFMSRSDYLYRLEITDKFIYDIWAGNKVVVVDNISKDLRQNTYDDFNIKHYKE
ncbi:MAG: hypothetical protein C3F02_02455 [Parcubacteria group bacterium]|nr:MAG: hypothetical protein C3F02_02455 [Parcubacteria group bacterium]